MRRPPDNETPPLRAGVSEIEQAGEIVKYRPSPITLERVRATSATPLTLERYWYIDSLGILTSPITWPPGRIRSRDKKQLTPAPAGSGPVRGERSPPHAALLRAKRGVR